MRTNSYSELLENQRGEDHVVDAQYHPVASFLQLIRRLLTGPEIALKILAVETSSFAVLGVSYTHYYTWYLVQTIVQNHSQTHSIVCYTNK